MSLAKSAENRLQRYWSACICVDYENCAKLRFNLSVHWLKPENRKTKAAHSCVILLKTKALLIPPDYKRTCQNNSGVFMLETHLMWFHSVPDERDVTPQYGHTTTHISRQVLTGSHLLYTTTMDDHRRHEQLEGEFPGNWVSNVFNYC